MLQLDEIINTNIFFFFFAFLTQDEECYISCEKRMKFTVGIFSCIERLT